ncbi:hypothetical protein K449DRAFT_388637 [Hypoxylon sp. EC38]|nr:hypothetical protein K449DRAFT_388637 [Hypoxylon sp. EC38]
MEFIHRVIPKERKSVQKTVPKPFEQTEERQEAFVSIYQRVQEQAIHNPKIAKQTRLATGHLTIRLK